ncbi:rhomboid family intramembrane serine protease [Metabacillus idriensis]|uniref:rhomboid family intramembrane serine protease n=1 Tax=Metabacillus idriensis TaxID=324768 RepID=UPI00174928C4|nr:rhomboid family intramembrane serine protease [Metabacillus idriensis]
MFTRSESFRTFIRLYPVVSVIVCIQVVLWLLFLIPIPTITYFFASLVGYNAGVANGEYWRLVTPIFLHASFAHILFNSVSIILFAPALERMLGKVRFAAVYLLTGIVANLATFFIIEDLTYTHLGASGAIFGLFGIYLYLVVFRKDMIDSSNSQLIITILVIGVVMTFINTNINIIAHIFGVIGGALLAPLFLKKDRRYT